MDAVIEGVILDMDGVIVDNYSYHCEAWRQFSKRYGVIFSDDDIKNTFGRVNREIFEKIFGRKIGEEESTRLGEEKEEMYRELYRDDIEPVPGLINMLQDLKQKGIKVSVASSAPISNISFVMDLLHLEPWVDAVVHSGMVKKGKPDPEVFLIAAAKLNVSPEKCVVFEDSLAGIEAGLRAGMKVIGLATTYREDKLSKADGVIKDFTGLNTEGIAEMLEIE